MSNQRLPLVASLIAIGGALVWSSGAVMSRSARGIDAFQYLIWRSIGIIVVMELVHLWQRRGKGLGAPMTWRAWTSGWLMVGANVGVFVSSLGFVYAVKTTTPANAAFLTSLTPLVTVVFSRFLGERLTRSTIIAMSVGVVGLVVTVVGDLEAGNMVGNASALLSSLGFALYTVCLRSDPERDWSPSLPGYGVLMIAVCTGVTLAEGHPLVPAWVDMRWALLHGAVVIVLGTLMFNTASQQVPAVPMTVFAQAEMVFVPVWTFVFLGDRPALVTILGGMIIFSAVIGKAIADAAHGLRPPHTNVADVPSL